MPRKDTIGPLKRKAAAGGFAYNKAFKQAVAEAYDFQYEDPRFHMALKMARDLILGEVSDETVASPALGKVLHYFDINLGLILCCEDYHKHDRDFSNLLEGKVSRYDDLYAGYDQEEAPTHMDLSKVLAFLNGLAEDPDINRDLRFLLNTSLSPCSTATANHPLIPSSNRTLTCMDVVNALLGVIPSGDHKGKGRVTLCVRDASDPTLIQFSATEPFVVYDPDYPRSTECVCGHPYERHWDWSDNDRFNCKYCGYACERFIPLAKQKTSSSASASYRTQSKKPEQLRRPDENQQDDDD